MGLESNTHVALGEERSFHMLLCLIDFPMLKF